MRTSMQEPVEADFEVVRGAWTEAEIYAPLWRLALGAAAAVFASMAAAACAGAALAAAWLAFN